MLVQKGEAVRLPHKSKIYSEFSHLYDKIFSHIFCDRIVEGVRSLPIQPGDRVLEIGIGTGLSLEAYPLHCEVVGIDIAPEMLEQARKKVAQRGWQHFRLQQMDALNLDFPDNSFDFVTAFHVVSVVPDPVRMMQEIHRVCKPEGTVLIINHFRTSRRLAGKLTSLIDPLTRRLGWSSVLQMSDVFDGVPLRIEKKYKTSPFSLFTIVVARNQK